MLAPTVGYRKYHICLGVNEQGTYLFLFLNSENDYQGDCIFPCSAFPTLPPSKTGQSVVSFSMLPRFTGERLTSLGAEVKGRVDKVVAQTLRTHLNTVRTLAKPEKRFVTAALDSLI